MLEEEGEVVAVDGAFAWIETQRKSSCGSCSVNKGCGTGVISKVVGQRATRVRALNNINAKAGEKVVIGLHDQALVRGSLAIYTAPLITMLLASVVGELVGQELQLDSTEGVTVLFGLAGLGLGFLWVRNFSRRIADDVRYQPVILRHCQADIAHEILIRIQDR